VKYLSTEIKQIVSTNLKETLKFTHHDMYSAVYFERYHSLDHDW